MKAKQTITCAALAVMFLSPAVFAAPATKETPKKKENTESQQRKEDKERFYSAVSTLQHARAELSKVSATFPGQSQRNDAISKMESTIKELEGIEPKKK